MSISPPKINFKIEPEFVPEIVEVQKILFVGQKTVSGSAAPDSLVQKIGNENEQDTLFGKQSMLAGMVRAAKGYNKATQMDALVLEDNGSTFAAGDFAITGTATETGILTFIVGSRKQFTYKITVTNGDTATEVGDALVAAIVLTDTSPFNSANVAGTVTLTAVNAGEVGNSIGVEITGLVAGISIVPSKLLGGATDPLLTTIFALVGDIRYQTVIMPVEYLSQTVAVDFMNNRFNPPGDKLLDGVCISTLTDTFTNLKTSTIAANSQSFVIMANRTVTETNYIGSALFELDYEISSQFGAVRSLRLTEDADISQFVISQQINRDSRGGIHISTLPYHDTPFVNLSVIDINEMWTDEERVDLKAAALGILGNNIANSGIIADDIVTRYLTNSAGESDLSFKFLNFVDQASTVRDVFHTTLKSVYAQSRLTTGSLVPGFNITNQADIKAELMSIYLFLAENAVVISGADAIRTFKNSITVKVLEVEGKVEITMLDPVVSQLREMDVIMRLTFSVNS